jgi:hypothetical protein
MPTPEQVCGYEEPCGGADECPDGGCQLICILPPHESGPHSIFPLDQLDFGHPAIPVEERS